MSPPAPPRSLRPDNWRNIGRQLVKRAPPSGSSPSSSTLRLPHPDPWASTTGVTPLALRAGSLPRGPRQLALAPAVALGSFPPSLPSSSLLPPSLLPPPSSFAPFLAPIDAGPGPATTPHPPARIARCPPCPRVFATRVRSFPRDPRRRRRRRFFPHVLTEAGWGGTARRSQPVADGCRSGVSPLCDRPSEAGIAIQSGPAPAAAKGRPPPADLDGKKAPSGHDGSCQLAQPRLFPRPGAGITSVDKS